MIDEWHRTYKFAISHYLFSKKKLAIRQLTELTYVATLFTYKQQALKCALWN